MSAGPVLTGNPQDLYDASFGALSLRRVEGARDEILRAVRLRGRLKVASVRAFLFRQHEPAVSVFTLETGKAKIGRIMENGREVILGIGYPGDVIGLSEVLVGLPRARFAQVTQDASVWVMERSALLDLLASDARLADAIMHFSAFRFLDAQLAAASLQARPVAARLVLLLIRLAQDSGVPQRAGACIALDFTREEIANMVGATRQSVCTLLGTLSRHGLIRVEGKQVTVRDWGGLLAWATEA